MSGQRLEKVKDDCFKDQGPQQAELLEKEKKMFKKSKYHVLIGRVKAKDLESRQVLRVRRLRCLQLRERSG